MGVNVELHRPDPRRPAPSANKRHRPRTPGTVIDHMVDGDDAFVRLLDRVHRKGRTPLLDKIDPYGHQRLTSADMPPFLAELDTLSTQADADDEHRVISELRGLAQACAADPALWLEFVGD